MLLQSFGKIPALEINDKPMYKYRGFMIDSGRYCQSVKEIKRFVNLMAMHKLNVFHWHLTEDQGWRVEIKKYPELTKRVRSVRIRISALRAMRVFYSRAD